MILEVVINSTAIMQIRGVRMQDVGRPLLGTLKLKSRDENCVLVSSCLDWTGVVQATPGRIPRGRANPPAIGQLSWHHRMARLAPWSVSNP